MLTFDFVTAGNATFTVQPNESFLSAVPESKPHYTFKVRHKPASGQWGETWFVSLLTGSDNENDYSYLGLLDKATGNVRLTAKSRLAENSVPVRIVKRVLARLAAGQGKEIEQAGWQVRHEGKCGRCGRTLTEPTSLDCGIGPECRRIMGGE